LEEDDPEYLCKDLSKASDEEIEVLRKSIEKSGSRWDDANFGGDFNEWVADVTGKNLCFKITKDDRQACVASVRNWEADCWNPGSGSKVESSTPALDAAADPVGTVTSSAADNFAEVIVSGLMYAMFWLLTRWL